MGFKVDSSFLRFLTMGALASQRAMELMRSAGLHPIELERYSSSNKIWTTKVKRLRLPDLLCVRSGLRVEVRGKGDLAIRMSDAPNNTERRWFAGLRDDDLIAFVQCSTVSGRIVPADTAQLFRVGALRECSESETRLGPPKSASEGSEQDREWRSIVPKRDGIVEDISGDVIRTRLDSGRKQTYQLRNMHPYVGVGTQFRGGIEFLAGLPRVKTAFSEITERNWDPRSLYDGTPVDRYVAAKALGVVGSGSDESFLQSLMHEQDDPRVALEAAGSMAKIGSHRGLDALISSVKAPAVEYLRMEAVFLLSELSNSLCRDDAVSALIDIATSPDFEGNEVRQAAIWGLGQAGLSSYRDLIGLLDTQSDDERIHAIAAFGPELPLDIVEKLVEVLGSDSETASMRASACAVLSKISNYRDAATELIHLACHGTELGRAWAKATLGAYPSGVVNDATLSAEILPLQLLSGANNWTKREDAMEALNFVTKQTVFPQS